MGINFGLLWYLAMEPVSTLLIMHKVVGRKGRTVLNAVLMMVVDLSLNYATNVFGLAPWPRAVVTTIPIAMMVAYVVCQYRETLMNGILIMGITTVVIYVVQAISLTPFQIAREIWGSQAMEQYYISTPSFLLCVLVYFFVPIDKIYKWARKWNFTARFISASVVAFALIMITRSKLILDMTFSDFLLWLSAFSAVSGTVYELRKQIFKTREKDEELSRIQKGGKFFYKFNGVTHSVQAKDIMYAKSEWRKVHLRMNGNQKGNEYEFIGKLDDTERELMELYPNFIRVNKSYLVNKSFIKEMSKSQLIASDGEVISITDKYRENVLKLYEGDGESWDSN